MSGDVPDNPNFKKWINTLRSTDLPQAREFLYADIIDIDTDKLVSPGYCCLGIACKIMPDADRFLVKNHAQLMPVEVADWLGLGPYWKGNFTTWAQLLASPAKHELDIHFTTDTMPTMRTGYSIPSTAAALNDAGFTFAQIADMIMYFGISEVQ